MIRPLTDRERATWNLEQPGARVTSDLAAENNRYTNLRVWAVTDRVRVAEWRAEQKLRPYSSRRRGPAAEAGAREPIPRVTAEAPGVRSEGTAGGGSASARPAPTTQGSMP